MEQLGQPPSSEDEIAALRSIKNGKAPRSSNILPKVVASNMVFVLMLKEIMMSVWDERKYLRSGSILSSSISIRRVT